VISWEALEWVILLGAFVPYGYCVVQIFRGGDLRFWLKNLNGIWAGAMFACALCNVMSGDRLAASLNFLWTAIASYLWWRNGGGDDFRRRRRRVAEAVKRIGSKLTVAVPAPAGGGA
jgi:hypothetical protein